VDLRIHRDRRRIQIPANLSYIVASAADEVSLMPQGELNLVRSRRGAKFFARRAPSIGWASRPNFAAMGQYKSAANMFHQQGLQPPRRKQEDDELVGSMYDQIVAANPPPSANSLPIP